MRSTAHDEYSVRKQVEPLRAAFAILSERLIDRVGIGAPDIPTAHLKILPEDRNDEALRDALLSLQTKWTVVGAPVAGLVSRVSVPSPHQFTPHITVPAK